MRIAITPLIAVLIWIDEPPYGYQLALALYTIASVTDYIDGYMARRLKVESPLGEMLDPIADKLLVAAVLLALANVTTSGWLFLVPALIILIREFMISGLREFLAKQKSIRTGDTSGKMENHGTNFGPWVSDGGTRLSRLSFRP